jgi:hypothetical protein
VSGFHNRIGFYLCRGHQPHRVPQTGVAGLSRFVLLDLNGLPRPCAGLYKLIRLPTTNAATIVFSSFFSQQGAPPNTSNRDKSWCYSYPFYYCCFRFFRRRASFAFGVSCHIHKLLTFNDPFHKRQKRPRSKLASQRRRRRRRRWRRRLFQHLQQAPPPLRVKANGI